MDRYDRPKNEMIEEAMAIEASAIVAITAMVEAFGPSATLQEAQLQITQQELARWQDEALRNDETAQALALRLATLEAAAAGDDAETSIAARAIEIVEAERARLAR